MAAFLPQVSLVNSLYRLLRPELQLKLHLFKNNVDPVAGSTLQSFVEPQWAGYMPQDIPELPLPVIDGQGRARVNTPAFTFPVAGIVGMEVVYGWFTSVLVGGGLREVHRVERWSPSKVLTSTSDPLVFSIYFLAANLAG